MAAAPATPFFGTSGSFPASALRGRILEFADDREWSRYLPSCIKLERLRMAQAANAAKEAVSALCKEADKASTAAALAAGPIAQRVAGKVWRLSLAASGCREVQAALDEAGSDEEREALSAELKGHVCEAISSPHANFVVQRCVEVLPAATLQFIINEIQRAGFVWAAKHKYGCRVIQRLIDRCPAEQVQKMVDVLLKAFLEVGRHAYGTHVLQLLLRSGPSARQMQVRVLVEEHSEALASHSRGGCGLLAAALEQGEEEAQIRLAGMLRHSPHLEQGAAAWRAPLVARLREAVEEVNSRGPAVQPTYSEPEREHWRERASSRAFSEPEQEPESNVA